MEFPPGSGKQKEKDTPADFERIDSESIVMVNPKLTQQAEGYTPKKRASVSMGGDVYKAKSFESIDGTVELAQEAVPAAAETAGPPPVSVPETKREFKVQLQQNVRSLEEIQQSLKDRSDEIKRLETEAKGGGIKETERFAAYSRNAETGEIDRNGPASESLEEKIVRMEEEIRELEEEKRTRERMEAPQAANDNVPAGVQQPVEAVAASEAPAPVAEPSALREEQPIVTPIRTSAPTAADVSKKRVGISAAMALFASALPAAAGQSERMPAPAATPPAAEAPRMPETAPLAVTAEPGDGADRLFVKLKSRLLAQYKDAAHAPTPVAKKIMETVPNALSRSLKLAEGDASATFQPGDSFELTPAGELVYRSGDTMRVLLESSGQEAVPKGPFSWRMLNPLRAKPADAAPAAAAAEPLVSPEQMESYRAQKELGGLPPNTDMRIKDFLKERATITMPVPGTPAETAPAPVPEAPAPQPEKPEEVPAAEPAAPEAEPVPAPVPVPEAPVAPEAAPTPTGTDSPFTAPEAANDEPVREAPAAPVETAPLETITNRNGVIITPKQVGLYRVKEGRTQAWAVWGGEGEEQFQKQIDFANELVKRGQEQGRHFSVIIQRTRPNPENGTAETTMYEYSTDFAGEHIFPPKELPLKPFTHENFIRPDERSAKELHGILGEH